MAVSAYGGRKVIATEEGLIRKLEQLQKEGVVIEGSRVARRVR
ncbi:MAG: hypothetical protein ABIA04_14490 [Pseudomonadota bacterium]